MFFVYLFYNNRAFPGQIVGPEQATCAFLIV
jgi:hypothetical protein